MQQPFFLLNQVAGAAAFSPTDVAGLTLWLKADAITGKSNSDLIDQWDDSSGSGNHFTASGGLRPTYNTNVENSLPGVLFSGAQRLSGTNYGNLIATNGHTAFVLARLPDYSLANTQAFIADSNFARWIIYSAQPTGNVTGRIFTTGAIDRSAGAPADGSVLLFDMRHGVGGQFEVKRNGGTLSGVAAANQSITANATEIGGSSSVSRPLTGYIFEIIVYNVGISDTDRTNVRNFLATKYGFVYS